MKYRLFIHIKHFLCIFFILFSSSLYLNAQDVTRDMPRKGEGIYEFLLRNNRSLAYYSDFVELNSKLLGKDKILKLGFYYKIPPKNSATEQKGKRTPATNSSSIIGETVTEPLFGAQKKRFKIESNSLEGTCFYIVAGHGGPDPGAIGKMGIHHLHEHEYAYDISLRLARELMMKGATVRIIIQHARNGIRDDRVLSNSKRATCMGDRIPLSQLARLRQRTEKINKLYIRDKKNYKYCRAIFLHLDSRVKKQQIDVFFYHYGLNPLGERLAKTMQDVFNSKYDEHQPNRGFSGTVSTRNLYVIKNTYPVALFVELGNIQNKFDQRRFVMSSNRQALAKWLGIGLETDYKKQKR